MRLQNLHVKDCKYLIKLQKDGDFTDKIFEESVHFPKYYFPCCCGLDHNVHTEAGKIKMKNYNNYDTKTELFRHPTTGTVEGLLHEDFVTHTKVEGEGAKNLTFLMMKHLFNDDTYSIIGTLNHRGLDVAISATDYAVERRLWLRKRAIIKLINDKYFEVEKKFFADLKDQLNLSIPRNQTLDLNSMLKALEVNQE